jgi:hypothetical protein
MWVLGKWAANNFYLRFPLYYLSNPGERSW